ncbi:MAG: class I SAM-dependent methyltransferase [Bacteroidota bacterium]
MNTQTEYYKKRAKEYDLVYQKPERQQDLKQIKAFLSTQFHQKKMVEIACGTGFWTHILAQHAAHIYASDINQEVIDIAQSRHYPKQNVSFDTVDLYQLNGKGYQGLFGGFIWSHIKKEELAAFVKLCQDMLVKGGELIFVDNKYVEGSSTPIKRTDEEGNTYQLRRLSSGEEFEVVKNFPNQSEFAEAIGVGEFEWIELDYFWIGKWTT